MLDEIRQLLREYAAGSGALNVAIVNGGAAIRGDKSLPVLSASLGGGAVVRAEFPEGAGHRDLADERAAALERTVRALRAWARRHNLETLPETTYPPAALAGRERILDRMTVFLKALGSCQGLVNALVYRHNGVVASAEPVDPASASRLPLLVRRVAAAAERNRDSSHAELCDGDSFATSFYYNAFLVAFFDGPYAVDFVRHRARLLIPELSHLLELLDVPPETPVSQAPVPK